MSISYVQVCDILLEAIKIVYRMLEDRSYRPDLRKAKRENKKHEVDPLWSEWQAIRRPFREQIDALKSQRLERLADKNSIDLPPKGELDFWEHLYRNFVLTKKGRFHVETKLQELKQKKGAYRVAWTALILSIISIGVVIVGDKISNILWKPNFELSIDDQLIKCDTLTFNVGDVQKRTFIRVHNRGDVQAENIKIRFYLNNVDGRLGVDNVYTVRDNKTSWSKSEMNDEREYNILYETKIVSGKLNQDDYFSGKANVFL